jgi:prepilin-type N-terminal cleavage/methylation domain-containing protein
VGVLVIRIRRFLLGRRGASLDAGFTMVELMIALAIFSIFLVVVMSSVVSITKASTTTQVTAQSSSAELATFQRMDHEVRYSDSINFPGLGSPSGDMYIEFETPATATPSGVLLCTQWRFDPTARVIQMRQWNGTTGVTPPTTWQTLLTNVANDGGANYPFQMLPAVEGGAKYEQLVLSLDTGNTAVKGAAVSSNFVARNTSIQSPSNTDDVSPGTSDIPICQATGGVRP